MHAHARPARPPSSSRRSSLAPIVGVFAFVACAAAPGAHAENQRVAALEAQLADAQARIVDLESTLTTLAADVAALKSEQSSNPPTEQRLAGAQHANADQGSNGEATDWRKQILVPDLSADERDHELGARPKLFVQTGYAAR